MVETLVLYTAKICPFTHRVEMALDEAKAPYTSYPIDLQNKPHWFNTQINPASKVPAIAYGGPDVDPSNPSPESVKLTESLVLVEFIADLYPESQILSTDPVQRAQARFLVDYTSTKLLPAWFGYSFRGEGIENVVKVTEVLQQYLEQFAKPYLGGDHLNIADIALAPFLGRIELQLRNDVGAFPAGQGPKVHALLFTNPKFATLQRYCAALFARESYKEHFDSEYLIAMAKDKLLPLRKPIGASPAIRVA